MSFLDYFGIFVSAVLVGGLLWALVDLLWKIHRQPKKEGPVDLTRLSSYPFVPEMVETEDPQVRPYPRELYR
jgi:hypothetical protein